MPRPPEVPAKGYLLADLTTGQVLVAHDVHRRLLTASTMKVLTALTLLPRLDPNQVYTAPGGPTRPSTAARSASSRARRTPCTQLFLGMMLSSGNDAANALANAAGGVPTTVGAHAAGGHVARRRRHDGPRPERAGRARAAQQRLRPGPHRPGRDAARRTSAPWSSTKTATFPGKLVKGKRTKGFQIQNHNELLSHYRGAIGVKTGYTDAAKWTYIGAARRGGHTYLVTEMGLSQPGWLPTTRLLDWAFAHGDPGHAGRAARHRGRAAPTRPTGPRPTSERAGGRAAGSTASPLARRASLGAWPARRSGRPRPGARAGPASRRSVAAAVIVRRPIRRSALSRPTRLGPRDVSTAATPSDRRRRWPSARRSPGAARRPRPLPTAPITAPAAIAVRSAERAPKDGSICRRVRQPAGRGRRLGGRGGLASAAPAVGATTAPGPTAAQAAANRVTRHIRLITISSPTTTRERREQRVACELPTTP